MSSFDKGNAPALNGGDPTNQRAAGSSSTVRPHQRSRSNVPIVSVVLTVRIPVHQGHADVRESSLAVVPAGATVRVETGRARTFDASHVRLLAEALAPAGQVQFNGEDGALLDALKSALMHCWTSAPQRPVSTPSVWEVTG